MNKKLFDFFACQYGKITTKAGREYALCQQPYLDTDGIGEDGYSGTAIDATGNYYSLWWEILAGDPNTDPEDDLTVDWDNPILTDNGRYLDYNHLPDDFLAELMAEDIKAKLPGIIRALMRGKDILIKTTRDGDGIKIQSLDYKRIV
jgi:hypothetical protein